MIGLNPAAGLSLFNRTLSRCMGLWGDGQTLYLSTLFQLWRFENSLGPGETYRGYDRLYVPHVTAVGRSDVADGWREHRAGGGLLIDVERNAVVLDDLSMPHSPRLYRDKLWLLDSGRGSSGM